MPSLHGQLYGNDTSAWLASLAIAGAVLLLLWLLVRVILRRVAQFASRTTTDLDDLLAHVGGTTRLSLLLIPALYVGSLYLVLPEQTRAWFRVVAWSAFLVQVAVWGDALLDFWLQDYREEHGKEDAEQITTVGALTFLLRLTLYAVVALVALDNIPGVEVTALIGSLGITGIAVALAVQNILGDLFASLSIALDRPFVLGDFIEVGGESGSVEHIGLKTTRIRRISGEELVIGNNDLLSSRIRNYGRMLERRVVFTVSVSGDTPQQMLEAVPAILREIVAAQPQVRFGRAHLAKLGSYSLDYEIVYYLLTPDYDRYMDTQQTINLAILRDFRERGIRIPYPTQTLYISHDPSVETGHSPVVDS